MNVCPNETLLKFFSSVLYLLTYYRYCVYIYTKNHHCFLSCKQNQLFSMYCGKKLVGPCASIKTLQYEILVQSALL